MTNLEFTQIMRGAGYEVIETDINQWYYLKNKNFFLVEDERKNELRLHFVITTKDDNMLLEGFDYKFTNVSQMNSVEFKKKLEGLTDYAYSLYMDINRHIDALSTKMETKAKRLGM